MKLPNIENYLVYIFLAIIILAGLYFLLNYGTKSIYKSFFPSSFSAGSSKFSDIVPSSPDDVPGCPNVLIRKGNLLLLIDTHSPPQMGKNPIIFKNLDEYTYYVSSQRDMGKKSCPILFLQEESNAQGEDVYRVRPGPFDQQNNGTPGAVMSISEISGIQKFFKDKPNATPGFVDKSAPASFNKEAKNVNTDAKTTGSGPSASTSNANLGPGPPVSNNDKRNRVENISIDNYNTTQKSAFKPAELSSPMGITTSSIFNPSTVVEAMQPGMSAPTLPVAPGMAVTTTSVIQGPITGPITTASVYPPLSNQGQPIQTPYFNGSLGPYNGSADNLNQSLQANPQPTPPRVAVPFVDASKEDPPYNQNQYTSFDPHGQFIGKYTTVDQVHDSTKIAPLSDNPMDPNWGGVLYTRNQVISGKYDDNNVTKPIYGGSVNVSAIPSLMPNGGIPIYVDKPVNSNNDQVRLNTKTLRSAPENA